MHRLPEGTTVVLAVTSRLLLAEDSTQRPLFLISPNYRMGSFSAGDDSRYLD
jgi:hypothetical protein